MFKYLFARLWKNPLARYGSLAAIILISFALIFSLRNPLYLYFSRLFTSPDWSDVARHSARPYAFEENENKARDLTASAWREIYDLAQKKLRIKERSGDALGGAVQRKPFAAFLTRDAEREIFTFFNALKSDCGNLIVSLSISDRSEAVSEIDVQDKAAGKLRKELRGTLRELLKIHALRVEAALQKKPDYLPAIELSEEVFRASCSIREIPVQLARALDYREYRIQKNIYDADNGRTYDKNPELFETKSREAYARDAEYRELIARYFNATRFRTPYDPAQLKNLRASYAALQNKKTLEALIAALLAEARNTAPDTARKCHAELFALDFPGVSDMPDYLYALAETALIADDFTRAENVIGNALASAKIKDAALLKAFERLRFQLELIRHASEDLSRF